MLDLQHWTAGQENFEERWFVVCFDYLFYGQPAYLEGEVSLSDPQNISMM